MESLASSPGARRLLAVSIVARLPPAMLGVGLLVQAQRLTGSFAAGGLVTGGYAIALGVGGPLLGRLVDRRGPTAVLLASAGAASALLITFAALPSGTPLAALLAVAAGVGLASPPVDACLQARLPSLLSDPVAIGRAYVLEASLLELTYIAGPPLALCLGVLWSGGVALAVAGLALLVATGAFAADPAGRGGRPARAGARLPDGPARDATTRGGALRTPALRTLVVVLAAVGALLGADEVAVIAVARTLHAPMGGAPLFAVWGAGSLLGGLFVSRLGGGARTATGLALLLAAMTAGHLLLIPVDGHLLALGVVLLVAGATIAPTEAAVHTMIGALAPAGAVTEAFAWLGTAMAVGGAAGSAGAGVVADRFGAAGAFVLAGAAGVLALLAAARWRRTGGAPRRHDVEVRRRDVEVRRRRDQLVTSLVVIRDQARLRNTAA